MTQRKPTLQKARLIIQHFASFHSLNIEYGTCNKKKMILNERRKLTICANEDESEDNGE